MSSDEAAAAPAEHEGRARRRRTRTLVIGAVAIAIPIADVAFNLGAQNAVFFGRVLALWAVATAVTVSLLVLDSEQTRVGRVGLLLMASRRSRSRRNSHRLSCWMRRLCCAPFSW